MGDAAIIEPQADILAVQKQGTISSDKRFEFQRYPLFQVNLPFLYDAEIVRGFHNSDDPFIRVQSIDITAVSASSVVQLGNNQRVHSLARQKHIRIVPNKAR